MTRPSAAPAWAWCNGRLTPFADAHVHIEDRGLQFGESLYEVVAVVAGVPFRLADHVERMRSGARELGLEAGVPPPEKWSAILGELHRREPHPTATLYLQVTGGTAPRRHVPQEALAPSLLAYLRPCSFPTPAEISRGITACTVPDSRWQRRDLKTTMLLPAVMAKQTADAKGAEEAIFVGQDGFVNEGASSTVFAVLSRSVRTPPGNQRTLRGVSAAVVAELCAQLDIAFVTGPLTFSDLRRAEEVFIASTSSLVMPVVRLDGDPVGNGSPGSVTLQLAYHFQRIFWAPAGR